MTEVDGLTFSYLEEHPDEAARVLESLEIEDNTALLASLPTRIGAPVLARLLPSRAALIIDSLQEKLVLALLGRMRPSEGVSIIRYLDSAKRSNYIARLPAGRAFAYHLLLGYPEETVGAWVDPDLLIMSSGSSAEEALNRFKRSSRHLEPHLYVVSTDRRLLGSLPLQNLLAAPSDTKLEQLLIPASFTLPASALLRSVADDNNWRHLNSIPVVEKGDRFIGVLHHSTMLARLTGHAAGPVQAEGESIMSTMTLMYWQLLSSLISLIVGLLPGNLQGRDEENH